MARKQAKGNAMARKQAKGNAMARKQAKGNAMARKQAKQGAQAESETEVAEPAKEAPAQFPDGYRTWLYSADCPQGQVFTGAAASQALRDGWVDHPSRVKD